MVFGKALTRMSKSWEDILPLYVETYEFMQVIVSLSSSHRKEQRRRVSNIGYFIDY